MVTMDRVVAGVNDLRNVETLLQSLRDELQSAINVANSALAGEQKAVDSAREQHDRAESAVAELVKVTADLDESATNLSLCEAARDDLAGKLAAMTADHDELDAALSRQTGSSDTLFYQLIDTRAELATARASMLANEQELQRADALIGDLRGQIASETARADAATLNGKAGQGTSIATMNGDFDALTSEPGIRPDGQEPFEIPSDAPEGSYRPDPPAAPVVPVEEEPAPISAVGPSLAAVQSSRHRVEMRPLSRAPRIPKEAGPPPEIGLRRPLRLVPDPLPRVVKVGPRPDRVLVAYFNGLKLPPGHSKMVGNERLDKTGQRLLACRAVIKALGEKAPEQVPDLERAAKLTSKETKQAILDLEDAGLLGKAGS